MSHPHSLDELTTRLPAALTRLSELPDYDVERMRAIALEEGLAHSPRPRRDDPASLRLLHSDDDAARVNRTIRASITKAFGTPTGTDKVYSSGPFIISLNVTDDMVSVRVQAQRSLESIGAAARAWMSRTPFEEWSATAGAVIMHPSATSIRPPSVRERTGGLSFEITLDASQHPAGVIVNDLPERRAALAAFFTGQLGEPETPPMITERRAWLRGPRQLMMSGFRSSGRHSLTFLHDDGGGGEISW